MTFGAVPVAEALGGILAHSLQVGPTRLRKGRVLSDQDLRDLTAAGIADVTVAILGADDVEENDAALRVARSLVVEGDPLVELSSAFTGRVNVIAKGPGIARIDAKAIDALNACDPMITCATVAPLTRLDAGGLIATIKIISYGVSKASLLQALQMHGTVGLIAPKLKSARLIVTETSPQTDPEKGVAAIRGRLDRLGVDLSTVVIRPHQVAPIADAIAQAEEDLILILTASATSDPEDTAPEALRQAGGKVRRFGMPVDPGNLLFTGRLAGKPVMGLPGCARSPALNGADWVLEREICGVEVTAADIAAMGVGGLLKEIPQRPQPRRALPQTEKYHAGRRRG
ncbi:MAG: molybdopterin-binding protein [Pseudomonadota bacterium]